MNFFIDELGVETKKGLPRLELFRQVMAFDFRFIATRPPSEDEFPVSLPPTDVIEWK